MTFRDLEVFHQVCLSGSMSKAAQNLFVSQPSVSQSISQLEEEFDLKLFNRLSHKLFITQEGELFWEYAKKLLHLKEESEIAMKAVKGNLSISIGATVTIGTYFLPLLLEKMKDDLKGVKIKSAIFNTSAIIKELTASKLDIALVEGKINDSSITTIPFYVDELVLICSFEYLKEKFGFKFQEEEEIATKCVNVPSSFLEGENFILREEGSGSRLLFEETMINNGIGFTCCHVYNNNEAIYNAAKRSCGIGVVSRLGVKDKDKGMCILNIEGFKMNRNFVFAYHKDKFINDSISKVMEEAKLIRI